MLKKRMFLKGMYTYTHQPRKKMAIIKWDNNNMWHGRRRACGCVSFSGGFRKWECGWKRRKRKLESKKGAVIIAAIMGCRLSLLRLLLRFFWIKKVFRGANEHTYTYSWLYYGMVWKEKEIWIHKDLKLVERQALFAFSFLRTADDMAHGVCFFCNFQPGKGRK